MAFGLGFIVSDNTAAIMVPLLIKLHEAGYGVAKGIPVTLLAAQSFDDVIAIPLFGVCQALTMNAAAGENTNIVNMLIEIFYKVIVGFVSAFVIGSQLWFFRNCGMTVKFFALVGMGIGQLVFYTLIDFDDSKYLSVIFMGYFALRVWGEDKPDEELNIFWNISKPFLFGSVGAQILIREMEFGMLGNALIIVLVGIFFRLITTYLSFYDKKFNKKERIFTAVAWLPKATVQAAFGGIILAQAKSRNLPELVRPGIIFLTVCILSIIVTAPPGAILTIILGEPINCCLNLFLIYNI
jgi:NhaP-type Na+/H+ or K+/H+ antiporter